MLDRFYPDARCREVIDFYFGPAAREDCSIEQYGQRAKMWFSRDAAIDDEIRHRFAADVEDAAAGRRASWRETATGRLGLVVLLDQFPRNLNRDSSRAFAHDVDAMEIVLEGIERGDRAVLTSPERHIFYLPLVHIEDLRTQERACSLYTELAAERCALSPILDLALKACERHHHIIEKFGRFPHRNAALGRASTPEELLFLSGPDSSF